MKETIGDRLVALRVRDGYSQHEVSKYSGISRVTISRYENDMRTIKMNIQTLQKFANFYGVPVDYILYGGSDEVARL